MLFTAIEKMCVRCSIERNRLRDKVREGDREEERERYRQKERGRTNRER